MAISVQRFRKGTANLCESPGAALYSGVVTKAARIYARVYIPQVEACHDRDSPSQFTSRKRAFTRALAPRSNIQVIILMKFHVAVFEFQSTINNGSAKRSSRRGEFLTTSLRGLYPRLACDIYIYIYYFGITGRLNRWTGERRWMRMTRIRKGKKGGFCGRDRNNAQVLEKMKIPRLEVIGIFHDGEFAVCSNRIACIDEADSSTESRVFRYSSKVDGICCANDA